MNRYTEDMKQVRFTAAEKAALCHRLQDSAHEARTTPRRTLPRALCIGIAAALCLSLGALATNGTLSSIFSGLFGAAPTDLMEEIGTPMAQQVSDGGVTMTADAIIADHNAIAIAITARRDDGVAFDRNIAWDLGPSELLRTGVANWSGSRNITVQPDGSMRIYDTYQTDGAQTGTTIEYTLHDLGIEGKAALAETVFAGDWHFVFENIKQPDTRSMHETTAIDGDFGTITEETFTFSPIGYQYQCKGRFPLDSASASAKPIAVFLVLKDGTKIDLSHGGGSSATVLARSGLFDAITALDTMDYVLLEDRILPLA